MPAGMLVSLMLSAAWASAGQRAACMTPAWAFPPLAATVAGFTARKVLRCKSGSSPDVGTLTDLILSNEIRGDWGVDANGGHWDATSDEWAVDAEPDCLLAVYDRAAAKGVYREKLLFVAMNGDLPQLQPEFRIAAELRLARDLEHLGPGSSLSAVDLIDDGVQLPRPITLTPLRSPRNVEAGLRLKQTDGAFLLKETWTCQNVDARGFFPLLGYLPGPEPVAAAMRILEECPNAVATATAILLRKHDPRALLNLRAAVGLGLFDSRPLELAFREAGPEARLALSQLRSDSDSRIKKSVERELAWLAALEHAPTAPELSQGVEGPELPKPATSPEGRANTGNAELDDEVERIKDYDRESRGYGGGTRTLVKPLGLNRDPAAQEALFQLLEARVSPGPVLDALGDRPDLTPEWSQRLRQVWSPADLVRKEGVFGAGRVLERKPTEDGVAYLVEAYPLMGANERVFIIGRARFAGPVALPLLKLALRDPMLALQVIAEVGSADPQELIAALPTLDRDASVLGQLAAAQAVAEAVRNGVVPADLGARLEHASALGRLTMIIAMSDLATAQVAQLLEAWSKKGDDWTRAMALEGLSRAAPDRVAKVKFVPIGSAARLVALLHARAAFSNADRVLNLRVERRFHYRRSDVTFEPAETSEFFELYDGGLARFSIAGRDDVFLLLADRDRNELLSQIEQARSRPSAQGGLGASTLLVATNGGDEQPVETAATSPLLTLLGTLRTRGSLLSGLLAGNQAFIGASRLAKDIAVEDALPALLRRLVGAPFRDDHRPSRPHVSAYGSADAQLLATIGDATTAVFASQAQEWNDLYSPRRTPTRHSEP